VTNRGKVRWKVFEGAMNADILIDYMKRLIKDAAGAKGDLKKATISHLRRLQKSPERVMRYLQHEPVRYAA
jgi:hypothetical protein